MDYATNFAIVENGIVTNILWGLITEEYENAVQTDDRPVEIGDTYVDGKFYRNGEPVSTYAEEVNDMLEALQILGVNA